MNPLSDNVSKRTNMSTRTYTEICEMLKNPEFANILCNIESTQQLIDLQMTMFKKHKVAFKRHSKDMEKYLEVGISEVGSVLKRMDKSIAIQKDMADCLEQMAKDGKALNVLLEERQGLIEAAIR